MSAKRLHTSPALEQSLNGFQPADVNKACDSALQLHYLELKKNTPALKLGKFIVF